MLSRLSIQNYAIISHLNVEFSPSLNVITGETGAGKSIIMGALGLILGQRAEANALLNKEKKCIVEGFFKLEGKEQHIVAFLKENDLDINDELVVRREITPNGKSRAFINDTPVNLSQLNQLSSSLVDLHQQFDTLELGETNFQREVMDALAGNFNLLKQYLAIYSKAGEVKKKLDLLKEQKSQFEKEYDYHQFQFNELEEAGFKENELEDLELQLKTLANAEDIKNALAKTYFELEESEEPILVKLKTLLNQLNNYEQFHSELPALISRLQSSYIELQDIADEVDRLNRHISSDAGTLEKINERISLGYRLFKKHGVKTTGELLQIKHQLNEKLQLVLHIDDQLASLEKELAGLIRDAEEKAKKISDARHAQVKPFEQKVNKMLSQVGMPNARIVVDIKDSSSLKEYGSDNIEFLFDANAPANVSGKHSQMQPLRKVASGGELSRLMLCIKSLVAKSMDMPTLIFDEIDTGISGEAAKQVGVIMKQLADARQIITITHQPQIAGKADAHYFVFKQVVDDAVTTNVRLLNTDERIIAIAKMLSGEKPTAAALENAREMVMN